MGPRADVDVLRGKKKSFVPDGNRTQDRLDPFTDILLLQKKRGQTKTDRNNVISNNASLPNATLIPVI